jgi:hypothetical protein
VGTESILSGPEIGRADLKGVVPFAQGILDTVSDAWRQISAREQGQHLGPATQEHLVTAKPLGYG